MCFWLHMMVVEWMLCYFCDSLFIWWPEPAKIIDK